jgi:hypothetical protein
MSFLRHREIYQISEASFRDEELKRARPSGHALTHRLDESRLDIPGGLLSSIARFRFTNRRLLCDNRLANCKKAFAGTWTPT